jgi:hypothetical protein
LRGKGEAKKRPEKGQGEVREMPVTGQGKVIEGSWRGLKQVRGR